MLNLSFSTFGQNTKMSSKLWNSKINQCKNSDSLVSKQISICFFLYSFFNYLVSRHGFDRTNVIVMSSKAQHPGQRLYV